MIVLFRQQQRTGTEAIEIIESTPIDIVITDVRMPSLDGIGLAKIHL